jgi:hypothetical protein
MDCNFIYSDMNDGFLIILYEQNLDKGKLKEYFIDVCGKWNFMENDEVSFIIQEINYKLQNILVDYQTNINNKDKVLSIYYQTTFYDLYYILVHILRPVQNYINYNLISGIVSKQENYYLLILLLFLTINILVDLLIFFFIK